MRQIKIEGFSENIIDDLRPAVCVFGAENSGTTRFGMTLPHSEGYIGCLAVDGNSKITIEEFKDKWKLPLLVNSKPFITHAEAIGLASNEDPEKVKKVYSDVMKRVTDQTMLLVANPNIESILVDRISQIWDYILFSHFGRKNQIDSMTQRPLANQDMIDFINALRAKNLVLACKASEVYQPTGEVDKMGRKKSEGTGKFKPDGFSKIGQFVTATIELTTSKKKLVSGDEDEEGDQESKDQAKLAQKFKARIQACKKKPLLENVDLSLKPYRIAGDRITWDNIMTLLGIE